MAFFCQLTEAREFSRWKIVIKYLNISEISFLSTYAEVVEAAIAGVITSDDAIR